MVNRLRAPTRNRLRHVTVKHNPVVRDKTASDSTMIADLLTIAGESCRPSHRRHGEYSSNPVMVLVHEASGTEMVTAVVQRVGWRRQCGRPWRPDA